MSIADQQKAERLDARVVELEIRLMVVEEACKRLLLRGASDEPKPLSLKGKAA